jgi:hypothetical protein
MAEIEFNNHYEYNDFETNLKFIHAKHKIFEVSTEQNED